MTDGTNRIGAEKAKIILIGVTSALLYWLVAALVMCVLFGRGGFFACLFTPGLEEVARRAVVLSVIFPVTIWLQIRMFSRVTGMLRDSRRKLSIVSRMASVFVSFEGEDAYSHALRVVLDATGSTRGVLGYVDENGDLVCGSLTKDDRDRWAMSDKTTVFKRDDWNDLWGQALKEKQTFYSNRPSTFPDDQIPISRNLVTPIVYKASVIGHIEVANKPSDYDCGDVQLLEAVAEHVAPVLHARLLADSQKKACRLAQETLRETEERWNSLTENTDDLIAVVDRNDKVRYVNRTVHAATPDEVAGHSLYEFAAQESHALIRCSLEAAYATGRPQTFEACLNSSLTGAAANGQLPWFSAKVVPMKTGGEVCGLILIATNITDRKRVEELTRFNAQLEQANLKLMEFDQMKSEFLSNVSHELRTPIASVRAYAESLMEYDAIPREQQESFLRIIVEQSIRLTTVLNDLLDLAKIEAGELELELEPVKFEKVARAALESVEPLAEQKGVDLGLVPLERDVAVVADEQRLVQVLVNLLNNAVKFTGPRGVVTLSCKAISPYDDFLKEYEQEVSHLRITVSDSGEGIPPEDVGRVFDKFKQVADRTKSRKGGTGLGLAICRELVERMGGKIWAESIVGKGSSFHFTLPIATDVAAGNLVPANSTGHTD